MNPFESEPVVTTGVIMAIIYIAVAFGAPISAEQQRTMQDQLPVVLPAFAAFIAAIRQMVYAPDTARNIAVENVQKGYNAATAGKREPLPSLSPPP